ncbi:MAG TPA: cache domain-containing protein [Ktedonobacterales bacterium]|nr:cache domain-containing protein [Ktedonobacterales bacterium]
MAQSKKHGRRRLPLSARLTLLVLFAALIPLAAVVGINDYLSRGTLLSQGHAALSTDANAKATLVETYIHERLLDGQALATLPTAVGFLACAELPTPPPQLQCATQNVLYQESSQRALAVGIVRDSNYTLWSIFDATGHPILTSDANVQKSSPPPTQEDLQPVLKEGKQWVSAVYYDSVTKHAFVRLYTPISVTPGDPKTVLGFLQATLRLDYVWNIVKGERGLNGDGSYAFMTDQNGIVIADPNQSDLFTTIRPLDAATQNQIASEKRFGSTNAVSDRILPGAETSLDSSKAEDTFEGIAQPGDNTQFQFVRVRLNVQSVDVPWSYFVLSPVATVTRVADDQIRTSLLSAAVIAILAVLIGLFIGSRVTNPVRGSVSELQGASAALKELASRQESSASEQHWVVDACRTGLESIRYLSDAMNQAARRIIDASNWFNDYWDRLTEDQARRTVQHLLELAHYIDEAARRQQASNERMDKAIMVTQQVSDQLVSGATAANRSAGQLEMVVDDLQHVVGGRAQPRVNPVAGGSDPNGAPNGRAMQPAGAMAPARPAGRPMNSNGQMGGQMGGQMMRAPQAPVHFGQMGGQGPMGPMGPMGPASQMGGQMGPMGPMGGPPSRRNPGSRAFNNPPSQYGPPEGFNGYPPAGRPSRVQPDDQWGAPAGAGWDDQ